MPADRPRLDGLGTSGSARFAAYEPRTGEELRRHELASTSPSPSTMYVFDYGDETLLALDVKLAEPRWTSSRNLRVFSHPACHAGRL